LHTYPGNIHVHSRYSDGSGSLEEIAADAAAAGLSYVITADHETLGGLPEEAIRHGVAMLVGIEINHSHCHYVALNLSEFIPSNDENPQLVIDRVNEAGGLGFIAHPFEKGSRYLEKGRAYPWKIWPVFRFQGIEIWNYTSHWRGRDPSLLKTLYWFLFDRKGAMDAPSSECLRLWDCYNIHNYRITGIGSSDAHAFPYNLGLFKVKVFTYRYIFKTINTYIVLEDELSQNFELAKQQIIGALREGRCYISFDSLHSGSGFSFYAAAGDKIVQMGGEITARPGVCLHVKAPARRSQIRLIRNGRLFKVCDGSQAEFNVAEPGVYRAEVFFRPLLRRPRPWIYSNPIYLR